MFGLMSGTKASESSRTGWFSTQHSPPKSMNKSRMGGWFSPSPKSNQPLLDKPSTIGQKKGFFLNCGSPLFSPSTNNRKGPHMVAGRRKNDFRFKLIKDHKFDKVAYDESQRIAAEKEEFEKRSREVAKQILTEYGTTEQHVDDSLNAAKITIKRVHTTNQKSRALIEHYKRELLEHKERLVKMESIELENLIERVAEKEELMNNHGHKKSFFQVPKLTKTTLEKQIDEEAKLERAYQRAIERGSKFAITDIAEHFKIKNMIKRRMLEISQFLATQMRDVS